MDRRITACFPFSPNTTIFGKNGTIPPHSGVFDASEVLYGLYYESGGNVRATVRPSCDGPHSLNSSIYSGGLGVERAVSNLVVTGGGFDALHLTDFLEYGSPGLTITEDHAYGPWGPNGETATLIEKGAAGSFTMFYYASPLVNPSVLNQDYVGTVYVKVLSGTLRVRTTVGAYSTHTSAEGWVRAESLYTGNGVASVYLGFYTENIGDSVTFLCCCAQVEAESFPTSFVNGSRAADGKFILPQSLIPSIQNFSFSCWVAPHLALQDQNSRILQIYQQDSSSTGKRFIIYRVASTNRISILISPTEITESTTNFDTAWTDGQWHHLFFTMINGAGTLYIDGASAGTVSGTQREFTDSWTIKVGSGIYPLDGILADVTFYNRGLTSTEVISIYTMYGGASPVPVYNNLSNSLLPQPTERIVSSGEMRTVRFTTESGTVYIDSLNSVGKEEISLQYGPLQSTDIYFIKDFYEANGGHGTFYFTPLNGSQKLYRFTERPFASDTTRPELHSLTLTVEKVT